VTLAPDWHPSIAQLPIGVAVLKLNGSALRSKKKEPDCRDTKRNQALFDVGRCVVPGEGTNLEPQHLVPHQVPGAVWHRDGVRLFHRRCVPPITLGIIIGENIQAGAYLPV
jgi:hypothetical protein